MRPKRKLWRRFRPLHRQAKVETSDIFGAAWQQARQLVGRRVKSGDLRPLNEVVGSFRQTMNQDSQVDWLVLILLQTPQAARAQVQMDKHPHGYHDRKKRLYELIDFNDSFVSLVLLLGDTQLPGFTQKLWNLMEKFSEAMNSKLFTPEQFEAITRGLSREVAVFRSAKAAGFEVRMTSRSSDAFGIDMQIRDKEADCYINVDCKTGSAFHFRLTELVHEDRLAPHEQTSAETKGYWEIVNRHDDKHVRIILLRIAEEELGEIVDFSFVDSKKLIEKLTRIIAERGLSDGRFGMELV